MDDPCRQPESQRLSPDASLIFDYERSLARLGGDPSLFKEIALLFLEDSPQLLDQARQGLQDGNLRQVERAAHSLKGLSVNFEARALAGTAAAIEQHCRDQDLSRAAEYFADLEREWTRLQDALASFDQ